MNPKFINAELAKAAAYINREGLSALAYDRTVSLSRATTTYPTTGMATNGYATIATGIACSIQRPRPGEPGVPTDDTQGQRWRVLVAPTDANTYQLDDRLTDDLGRQLRVTSAYPTPLGWELMAEDLMAHGGQ